MSQATKTLRQPLEHRRVSTRGHARAVIHQRVYWQVLDAQHAVLELPAKEP